MYKIESLDHYARGICRVGGKITFVENALKGEEVDIKIIKEKKNFNLGKVLNYIKKSNDRISPKCPYYDVCGGCNIMHTNYINELAFKEEKIKNIVSKYLSNGVKINEIVKCDNRFFYRNKVSFQVKENLGFYKTNSYELVNIDKCVIANEIINDSIKYLKKLDLKYVNKIICKVGLGELMVIIDADRVIDIDILKKCASSIYLKINDEYILLYGKKYIYEDLDGYKFAISPDSFFQTNINTCLKLYRKIKDYIKDNKNILDLYCGTGSIGIFISGNNSVKGVEINKSSILDAIYNKKLNKIKNIDFICGDSGKNMLKFKDNFDVIIVDPPRNGLNNETLNNILKLNPKEIIYVSCEPMTMVRDLNVLSENYKVCEITPFDMFPNTYHIECLTYLVKM